MSIDALFKQANALQMAGDFAGAEKRYRGLTKLKPLWAFHNLGVLYAKLGRDAEAETALRAALAADPGSAATRHTLGMLLLRLGRYAEGWPEFEARRDPSSGAKLTRPNLPYPSWSGEDLAGKHLVVVREQGFGDQVLFARFLPRLAAMAGKLTYVCSPNLVRLFAGLGAELVPASQAPPPSQADFWTPDCSLGLRLGVTPATLSPAPYLSVPPTRARGGVGIMVATSATGANAANKALRGAAADALLALGQNLAPEATGAADFQDTAEIIAGLDLVISVDTAVAHVAAAMGKPTWVLIPAIDTDWRWMGAGDRTPWFGSAKLYRQPGAGRWPEVVRQVIADAKAAGLA